MRRVEHLSLTTFSSYFYFRLHLRKTDYHYRTEKLLKVVLNHDHYFYINIYIHVYKYIVYFSFSMKYNSECYQMRYRILLILMQIANSLFYKTSNVFFFFFGYGKPSTYWCLLIQRHDRMSYRINGPRALHTLSSSCPSENKSFMW